MKSSLLHTVIAIVLTVVAVLGMEYFRHHPKPSKPDEALVRLEKAIYDRELAQQEARITKNPVDVVKYERALAKADQVINETSSIPGAGELISGIESKFQSWAK